VVENRASLPAFPTVLFVTAIGGTFLLRARVSILTVYYLQSQASYL
jgi:hypothetical protein